MTISLIVAMSRNRVIGASGAIPWKLPADMRQFRALTMGKPIIMGRKTFESIAHALPGRKNIVMTRDGLFRAEGCHVASSREEALASARGHDEVMVIGGEGIYKEFLPIADRIYLTLIDEEFAGDAFFPELDMARWKETGRTSHEPDAKNEYPYTFITLEKK